MKSKTEVKTDFISDFQVLPDFSDKVASMKRSKNKRCFSNNKF